jgi:twitching motility protein PilT
MTQTTPHPAGWLLGLLRKVRELGGSDLHLRPNQAPSMTCRGELASVPEVPVLTATQVEQLALAVLPETLQQRFAREREWEFAWGTATTGRYRLLVFRGTGGVQATIRLVPDLAPLESLGLPGAYRKLLLEPHGLILVGGPPNSGKSTILASTVDFFNDQRRGHVVTIEDPVEIQHVSRAALVTQRQVGTDVESFAAGIRSALRMAPSALVVSRLVDRASVLAAVQASASGVLVVAGIEAWDTIEALHLMLQHVEPHEQPALRHMLAGHLRGCLVQWLLPRQDSLGRVAAHELLLSTTNVAETIRLKPPEALREILTTGSPDGQISPYVSLMELLDAGVIQYGDALVTAPTKQDFVLQGRAALRALREKG